VEERGERVTALDEALACLRRGWSLLPLQSKSKEPAYEVLPRDDKGNPTWKPFTERLPTEDEVRKWLADGGRNYGLVGGAVSGGLCFLDLDRPEAAYFIFGRPLDEVAASTPVVFTGPRGMAELPRVPRLNRGLHVYFRGRVPTFKIVRRVREHPGKPPDAKAVVEVKSEAGYVVGPGSTHPSGLQYTWAAPPPENLIEVDESGLRRILRPWLIGESILPFWQEGTRHDLLKAVAAYLRKRQKWPEEETTRVLERVGGVLGIPEREVRSRVREVYREDLKRVSMRGFLAHVWGKGAKEEIADLEARLDEVLDQEPRGVGGAPVSPAPIPQTPGGRSETWAITDTKSIEWTPEGITLVVDRGRIDRTTVIAGYVRPLDQVDVDGDIFFRVALGPSREIVTTADQLMKRLDREARVVAHGPSRDVLNQVLRHFAPNPVQTHATFGAYADDAGRLALCLDPTPVQKEQETAHDEISAALGYNPVPEDFQAYADFASMFHEYEVLPAMGLGAMAPFALELRRNKITVPHAWLYSPEKGLGKDLVAWAFSSKMWGREALTGDALNSDFRFAALCDSACVPLVVDEAERLDSRHRGADLKAMAERAIVDKRGTAELGMVTYRSRAVLLFTGNAMVFPSGPELARFLVSRFDSSKLLERRARHAEGEAAFARLRPVGLAVARAVVEMCGTGEALVSRVRKLGAQIEAAAPPELFKDPRRAEEWGVVCLGLQAWEAVMRRAGAEWSAPDITDFVERVVRPVEGSTWEGETTPLDAFLSSFAIWRTKNTVSARITDERGYTITETLPKGKGEIWDEGVLEVGSTRVPGYFVTRAILDQLNREQPAPDLKIRSLKELAIMGADRWGIPRSAVLDRSGQVPLHYFGTRRERAAFVPAEEPPEGLVGGYGTEAPATQAELPGTVGLVRSRSGTEPGPSILPIFYHGREVVVRDVGGGEIPAKDLHEQIAWRVRNRPGIPVSFLWQEIAPALRLPEDVDTRAVVEGYAEALKAMRTWPEASFPPLGGNDAGTGGGKRDA